MTRHDLNLAQLVPQAGSAAAGRDLDGLVEKSSLHRA
jgi:hypothetical protein